MKGKRPSKPSFIVIRVTSRRELRARAAVIIGLSIMSWWLILTLRCRDDPPNKDCPCHGQ